ncbi:MAG TPA: ABC transporter permease [Candidatus Acidoferrales bacterium]|nr:ABC transporter permease [Candidatus Acidoferrales bacterium]
MTHTWALSAMRMRLALRNRAFFFFTFLMPLIFLFGALTFFGKGSNAITAYVLGAILTITVMGSFWGLSVQLVTFREQGILRRFRLSPVTASDLLASSIISNYFLTLPIVIIEVIVCRYFFHLQHWGNLWQMFVLVTLGSAAFAAFGLIVASIANTMQETQMINNLLWSGFLFLSGATIPIAKFPHWLQRFSLFIPATYLAHGLESAANNLATAGEILTEFVALILGLAVAFEISRQIFRWEPEAKLPRRAKLWAIAALIPFLFFGAYENLHGGMLRHVNHDFRLIDESTAAPVHPVAPAHPAAVTARSDSSRPHR